ncbi:hypothetical protein [Jannaschia ovalis]|uniref:Uncharacterized protein n=1 Tax=Jannaschia ovalis TaxID=3038773 RepID=A0ABY8L8X5_9RHOB|nr:hypothetical protein [Jannaschia sp. GRR-S6-38]WGH77551.1 hypothetical protein P8627_10940 [Jannaschia sp. GRR-S6-38]
MTHARMALPMGAMMGAMVPLMAHGVIGGAGFAFAALHGLALLALAALLLFVPALRARLHRPTPRMLGRMALGAGAGAAIVCLHCLATWHGAGWA